MKEMNYIEFRKLGLGNPSTRIVKLLRAAPMSAVEVAAYLEIGRATVSGYLNALIKSGQVEKRKKGRTVYFGLKKRLSPKKAA